MSYYILLSYIFYTIMYLSISYCILFQIKIYHLYTQQLAKRALREVTVHHSSYTQGPTTLQVERQ
jgi:hypothetical protein